MNLPDDDFIFSMGMILEDTGKSAVGFFLFYYVFLTFFFQMQTTYQVQGMHMRLDFVMNDSKEANCDPNKFNVGILL